MDIVIDDYSFDKTSQLVFKINDSIRGNLNIMSAEGLREFMVDMAHRYIGGEDANLFSTGGFVLTGYKGYEGARKCKKVSASVTPGVVEHYLSKLV
jgi:hypothetical protein